MDSPKFKKATKEELVEFVQSYPKRLERDICHVGDPPLVTYNDFSEGNVWPQSAVAWHLAAWPPDCPESKFHILSEPLSTPSA